jgi:ribosomal protein S12 methylthiotransferase accessory factor
VERYCSAQYDKESFPLSAYEELKCDAVSPQDFALFSEQQYKEPDCPFVSMTPKAPLRWVPGFSLVSESEVLLPAAFVYVPYKIDKLKESPTDNPVSTGLACAPNLTAGIYKGILEAVERDAFMITWQNRIEPPSLDIWGMDDPFVQRLLNTLKNLPVRVHAAVLTLDIQVPVILIMITSESGHPPYTVVGLGTDLNPTRAVVLALEEAILSLTGIGRYAQSNPDDFRPAPDYLNVETLDQHALAHAISPDLRQSAEFLTKSNTVLSIKDLPDVFSESMVQNVRAMVNMIRHKDLDVIFVDLTTPDINECGFKVVRVVVPGLQPLDINHKWQHLGGERLYQVPYQLGLINKPLTEESLNPYPHPFP